MEKRTYNIFSHSIKNPHIIHFIRKYEEGEYHFSGTHRYLCCGSFTLEKSTTYPSMVTCKNCLKIIADRMAELDARKQLRFPDKCPNCGWFTPEENYCAYSIESCSYDPIELPPSDTEKRMTDWFRAIEKVG